MADPLAFFELLAIHNVEYIVIDKLAAALHGVPVVAESIAIWPLDTHENNENLAKALSEANCMVQAAHGLVEVEISRNLLELSRSQLEIGIGLRFVSEYGTVDVIYEPKGLEQ